MYYIIDRSRRNPPTIRGDDLLKIADDTGTIARIIDYLEKKEVELRSHNEIGDLEWLDEQLDKKRS